jgi:glycerol-3-phosphate dehydrogenase (NAD(P)+)
MAKIAVLGCGWGTALAVMNDKYGHEVTLWSPFKEEIEEIERFGEHRKHLPGVPVSPNIFMTTDISNVKDADIIIIAVPSFAIRDVSQKLKEVINKNANIVCAAKGLEDSTLKRLSEVISEELPNANITVLSGPSHAEEVARGVPTSVVAASNNIKVAEYVRDTLINENFRIYSSTDVIGVEVGGAIKNVIALCAGICDGLSLGDNTKAALMTRGISEISNLGDALGANKSTFAGLSGIGDLIVTCMSMHSRNRRAGIFIGQGLTPEEAVKRVGMTVEGYHTTKTAYKLANKLSVSMPIVTEAYKVLYEHKDPETAVKELMGRPAKKEH